VATISAQPGECILTPRRLLSAGSTFSLKRTAQNKVRKIIDATQFSIFGTD